MSIFILFQFAQLIVPYQIVGSARHAQDEKKHLSSGFTERVLLAGCKRANGNFPLALFRYLFSGSSGNFASCTA